MPTALRKTLNTVLNPLETSSADFYSATKGRDETTDALGHAATLGLGGFGAAYLVHKLMESEKRIAHEKSKKKLEKQLDAQMPILDLDHSEKAANEDITPYDDAASTSTGVTLADADKSRYWHLPLSIGAMLASSGLGWHVAKNQFGKKLKQEDEAVAAQTKRQTEDLVREELLRNMQGKSAADKGKAPFDLDFASDTRKSQGGLSRAGEWATALYLLYGGATGATAYHLAKAMADEKDPARQKMKALNTFARKRSISSKAPHITNMTELGETGDAPGTPIQKQIRPPAKYTDTKAPDQTKPKQDGEPSTVDTKDAIAALLAS